MSILTDARAEALFASDRQPSEHLTATAIEIAIKDMVKRHGVRGCAACVAFEFGDHPDIAKARMDWAIATVAATYPGRSR